MKKKLICAALAAFVFALFSPVIPAVSAAGKFETPRFDVNITVGEDNVLHVEERITMNLVESSRGLLRNIPYESEITRVVNGKVTRENKRAVISNIKVEGQKFKTYKENKNVYIRIGDANKYLKGVQQYNISYDFALGKDSDSTEDLLYFNFLPSKWNSSIENCKLTIHMPKSFDSTKLEVIATSANQTDLFDISVSGNTITATLKTALRNGNNAAAVMLHLPEGYFSKAGTLQGAEFPTYLILLGTVLFALAAVIISRQRQKPVKVIEYLPPEDMTSAEMGYLYRAEATDEHLVSLIIYWADKGYLSIEEKTKKDIYLHQLKDISNSAPAYEKYLFNALFSKGNTTSMKLLDKLLNEWREKSQSSAQESGDKMPSNFGATSESFGSTVCINDLKYEFSDRIQSAKDKLKEYMEKTVAIFKEGKRFTKPLLFLNVILPLIIFFLYAKSEGVFPSGLDYVFLSVVAPILLAIFYFFYINVNINCNSGKQFVWITAAVIATVSLFYLLQPSAPDVSRIQLNVFAFSVIASMSNLLLFMLYHKPYTDNYLKMLGRVLGFRDFIEKVEEDKLKQLVEEYPHYFYNILPYAYVLGVSKKWAKNFETIAMQPPTWYSGVSSSQFDIYMFTNNMNSVIKTTSSTLTSTYSESGSSSSDSSSYSSGGGSSDGGSGGGGGDTW